MYNTLTYSIIAGSLWCTCNCGCCISKMTDRCGITISPPDVDWRRFEEATNIAWNYGARNVLITGKGEPTLFPAQITMYLNKLQEEDFNTIELQTNGYTFSSNSMYEEFLEVWRDLGLTTIAISVYHHNDFMNDQLFVPRYEYNRDLVSLIEILHEYDYNVRLSCLLMKGYIDSGDKVKEMIAFAKNNNTFLTLRTAETSDYKGEIEIQEEISRKHKGFVIKHRLSNDELEWIRVFLRANGVKRGNLSHGATVYNIYDQNVCLTTGMSESDFDMDRRHLIFFPQGWLTTSWENVNGGRIL